MHQLFCFVIFKTKCKLVVFPDFKNKQDWTGVSGSVHFILLLLTKLYILLCEHGVDATSFVHSFSMLETFFLEPSISEYNLLNIKETIHQRIEGLWINYRCLMYNILETDKEKRTYLSLLYPEYVYVYFVFILCFFHIHAFRIIILIISWITGTVISVQ